MDLARSRPTVLTWFMDASARGLQRPHSGTPRPPGASTPSGPWLILTVREAVPAAHRLARAEFAAIRLRLLKLGARIRETASRVRLAFAAACPEADLLRHLATTLAPAPG